MNTQTKADSMKEFIDKGEDCSKELELKYLIRESIVYKENKIPIVTKIIAAFSQPSDAVKFAKMQAQERYKYDESRPYEYSVIEGGKAWNNYFNFERLHND